MHWDERAVTGEKPLTAKERKRFLANPIAEENREFREGARLVLAGFESGVFVRNIEGDGSSGWALKLVEPFRGLGILARLLEKD